MRMRAYSEGKGSDDLDEGAHGPALSLSRHEQIDIGQREGRQRFLRGHPVNRKRDLEGDPDENNGEGN